MTKNTTTKPVSARKLAANRANAQKSTGPKTPEGKDRSRGNALKHGLRATDVVLMNDLTEPPEEFDDLLDSLSRDIQPANMVETLLVERLAVAHWRLRRAYRHESHCTYDQRIRLETDPARHITRDLGLGNGADLPIQLPPPHAFDQLLRYESNLNRTISQIMHQLIQLRTTRSPLFPTTETVPSDSPTRSPSSPPPPSSFPTPGLSLSNDPGLSLSKAAQTNPTSTAPESTQPPATKDLPVADPSNPRGFAVPPNPISRPRWRPGREPEVGDNNMSP